MSGKKKNVISKASPHTIKKFELIEEYIKSWAQKLLLNDSCNGLIFIDCMCNSGIYTDDDGNPVKGTALRVSEALREAARTYTEKNIHIYLNDKDKARVDELEKHLPNDERNFKIVTSRGDAHELLRTIGPQLYGTGHLLCWSVKLKLQSCASSKQKHMNFKKMIRLISQLRPISIVELPIKNQRDNYQRTP